MNFKKIFSISMMALMMLFFTDTSFAQVEVKKQQIDETLEEVKKVRDQARGKAKGLKDMANKRQGKKRKAATDEVMQDGEAGKMKDRAKGKKDKMKKAKKEKMQDAEGMSDEEKAKMKEARKANRDNAKAQRKGEMKGKKSGQNTASDARRKRGQRKVRAERTVNKGSDRAKDARAKIKKAKAKLERDKAAGTTNTLDVLKREKAIKNAEAKLEELEKSVKIGQQTVEEIQN